LYCLLHARGSQGTYVLRIEDTDRARSTEASNAGIQRDLKWLGLDWDEGPGADGGCGPYFQSQRLEIYQGYFDKLLASGHAYEAWETPAELNALRQEAQKASGSFRYRFKNHSEDEVRAFRAEGRVPVLRLRNPGHDVVVHDDILGDVQIGLDTLDDIVIRKADGYPTYHFAVVIDDQHMKISSVLRGQEHLMNTPKHLGLYEALGWESPRYGHMPLIFNPAGSKMSKRDKAKAARAGARQAKDQRKAKGLDVSDWTWLANETGLETSEIEAFMKKKNDNIDTAERIATALSITLPMIDVMDFRKAGYLPEALLNYLALLGWSPGDDRELMTVDEMIEAFSVDRVGKTPARFDPDKLKWMNGEYMRASSEARLLSALDSFLEVTGAEDIANLSREKQVEWLHLYRERNPTFGDMISASQFLFVPPTEYAGKPSRKHLLKNDGLGRLVTLAQSLGGLESWTKSSIESVIEELMASHQNGLGQWAMPIRIAVAGNPVTPSIYETLAFMTQQEVINRLLACHAHFEEVKSLS
jgi:glutamyl-tRNA synthetase